MATKKLNKSAWIRSQSINIPAKELVSKAKKEGFKITDAQVYTARSTLKKGGGVRLGKPGPSRAQAVRQLLSGERETASRI